jgi:hypothetical protein
VASSLSEWDQLVEGLSVNLVQDLRWRIWGDHWSRVRELGAPSEKLVYIFLVLSGPSTFLGVKRSLKLGSSTVDRALRNLLNSGFVYLDDDVLIYRVVV